jgi:hypothetical protein
LTNEERVHSIIDYGFTERQARFLVLVMRHAGVCVKRQYATLAGIANGGEKCNRFFEKLVRRGYAVETACVHNRARLYQVHHKPLYHAIGEPDSRYRRPVSARAVTERLMRLDAALMSPDVEWLTTRSEKLDYLHAQLRRSGGDLPIDLGPGGAATFPGTFPIALDPSGHVVLLYIATVPWPDDFRTFLVGHTALLSVASAWTLRLVLPPSLRRAVTAHETVVHEELETSLDAGAIADLKRYFFHRRRGTDLEAVPEALRAFLLRCSNLFAGPRFTHLYRRWLTQDDAALVPLPPAIPQALASGHGRVETVVPPHTYEHLAPLVAGRRQRRGDDRQWDRPGDETAHAINPILNPAP